MRPFPCYYSLENAPIQVNTSFKDYGIIVSNNINLSTCLNSIVNVAHARSNLILLAFSFSDIPKFCKLFWTYVQPIIVGYINCYPNGLHIHQQALTLHDAFLDSLLSLKLNDYLSLTCFHLKYDSVFYNILHGNVYFNRFDIVGLVINACMINIFVRK